jgi:hypothetical protein
VRLEAKHPGRDELVLGTEIDEELQAVQFALVCGDLMVDHAAAGLRPDQPARADHDVVAERVAAAEAAFRVLEHVGDGRKAGVRVRREWLAADAKVVEDGHGRGGFCQVVQVDRLERERAAVIARPCGDDG